MDSTQPGFTNDHINLYLRRLGAYAAKRLTRRGLRNIRNAAESFDVEIPGKVITIDAQPDLAASRFDAVRHDLTEGTSRSEVFRGVVPLELVVPRAKREAILRSVVGPLLAHGTTMNERWATSKRASGLTDNLVANIFSVFGDDRQVFTRFVRRQMASKWLMTADFCNVDKEKPNHAFVFTLHAVHDLHLTMKHAAQSLRRDYKNSPRGVDQTTLDYLRGSQRFTFAFLVPKDRRIVSDLEAARSSIDEVCAMYERFEDAYRFTEEIARWRALRVKANSNGFPVRLYGDMLLAAALAGAIGTLLAGEGRVEFLTCIPDRDKMNEWFDRLFFSVWSHNLWAFSMQRRYPVLRVGYGYDEHAAPGAEAWFDPLIRQDDYIAGTLASWDYRAHTASKPLRDYPLIREVLADNPNLAIFTLPHLATGAPGCGRLHVSMKPFL